MSKILSIGTAVPAYAHAQMDILHFMQQVFAMNETAGRRLRFLYHQCGIQTRYSVIPDYTRPATEWKFYPASENLEPFPSLEQRMVLYQKHAPALSVDAIRNCLGHEYDPSAITHLVTVSCTGMSAPGLDLQIMELMDLPRNISRTSINFMGCYAAIHAMKMADAICRSEEEALVLIVCTELCTLHFQREPTLDNIMSSLLFGDGSAAALISSNTHPREGLRIDGFYSEIIPQGKRDMAWELSSTGFLMTLSGYVPELIEEDFASIMEKALQKQETRPEDISHWCLHPGGKKILEAVQKSMGLDPLHLQPSFDILKEYGNLSSATILFVLKEMMKQKKQVRKLVGAAFGPGLTVETFTAHY